MKLFSDVLQKVSNDKTSPESAPSPDDVRIVHALRVNDLETTKRENNILLMGVAVPQESVVDKTAADNVTVNNILKTLKIETKQVKSIYRFNTKNDKHPPIIKVTLDSKLAAQSAVRSGKLLKNYNTENSTNVYVNPDLTPLQRQGEMALITERNNLNKALSPDSDYYFGIRSGQLKRINKNNPGLQSSTN